MKTTEETKQEKLELVRQNLDDINDHITIFLNHPLGERAKKALKWVYEEGTKFETAAISKLDELTHEDAATVLNKLLDNKIELQRMQQEQVMFVAQAYKDTITALFKLAKPNLGDLIKEFFSKLFRK